MNHRKGAVFTERNGRRPGVGHLQGRRSRVLGLCGTTTALPPASWLSWAPSRPGSAAPRAPRALRPDAPAPHRPPPPRRVRTRATLGASSPLQHRSPRPLPHSRGSVNTRFGVHRPALSSRCPPQPPRIAGGKRRVVGRRCGCAVPASDPLPASLAPGTSPSAGGRFQGGARTGNRSHRSQLTLSLSLPACLQRRATEDRFCLLCV